MRDNHCWRPRCNVHVCRMFVVQTLIFVLSASGCPQNQHFQMAFWVFNLVLAMQSYSFNTVQRSLGEYKDPIWRYDNMTFFASQLMPLGQPFPLNGLLLVFRETSLETWYVALNSFFFLQSKPQEKLPLSWWTWLMFTLGAQHPVIRYHVLGELYGCDLWLGNPRLPDCTFGDLKKLGRNPGRFSGAVDKTNLDIIFV